MLCEVWEATIMVRICACLHCACIHAPRCCFCMQTGHTLFPLSLYIYSSFPPSPSTELR